MKRLNAWLIVAFILLLASVATICAFVYSSGKRQILTPIYESVPLQNSKIISDDALPYTYLGTYKDMIVALDEEGGEAWSYPTAGSVEAIRVDADRGLIIAGSQGRIVYVLDAHTGARIQEISVGGRIYDVDYHPGSGRILVTAPTNKAKGTLYLFDLEGAELLKKSGRPARAVRFAPDGESFYSGDLKAMVTRMSLDGETLAETRMNNEIYGLDVSTDTGDVVAITGSGSVGRFDAELNTLFDVEMVGDGRTVAISQDGQLIGAGTREGDVYLLNAEGALQHSARLSDSISQIVLRGEKSYVVPLSTDLYHLDVSAAENFHTFMMLYDNARIGLFVLPVLLAAAIVLAFGRSRSVFFAFFASMRRHKVAYLLLIPSFALIIVFNYVPIGQAFFYAFTDWNQATTSMRDVSFIGFDNFRKMISEGYFLLGVRNMVTIMLFNFLKLLVPLIIAELVFSMSGGKRRYWFRFLLVLPMVVPGVVSTLMWKNIYDPTIGLINQILSLIGRSDLARPWLGNESTALGSIIFMGFPWVNSFAFLVFYGGLINIPGDLFEAARVDGSNPLWNLTRIHLPLITPQIKMIIILTFISSIQEYGNVLLLTAGGPGYSTYVPGYELYLNATKLGQYGYACALGLVMFLAILVGTILNMKIRTEEALG